MDQEVHLKMANFLGFGAKMRDLSGKLCNYLSICQRCLDISFSMCSSFVLFSLQETPDGLFSELISGTVSGVFVPLLPKSSFFF